MPKERIRDQAALYDVEVGWRHAASSDGGEGSVQVGVESHGHRTLIETLVGDAIPREELGRLLEDGKLPKFTGLWSSLDRDGINQLIRTLRRARDAAYGADA